MFNRNKLGVFFLFFPDQLEPLGKKMDTLDPKELIALACPTKVIRERLLCLSSSLSPSPLLPSVGLTQPLG